MTNRIVMERTGYTYCACRDCMEIAIGKPSKAFCSDCKDAGCGFDRACEAPGAYDECEEEIMDTTTTTTTKARS